MFLFVGIRYHIFHLHVFMCWYQISSVTYMFLCVDIRYHICLLHVFMSQKMAVENTYHTTKKNLLDSLMDVSGSWSAGYLLNVFTYLFYNGSPRESGEEETSLKTDWKTARVLVEAREGTASQSFWEFWLKPVRVLPLRMHVPEGGATTDTPNQHSGHHSKR